MLSIFDSLRSMRTGAVLIRMLLACVCGALIGLERSAKNRPAGFRTHILVCMGAAVAAVTGLFLVQGLGLPADVSRISGSIVTGLGFIGAGAIIITKKLTIKGLTTAAGLWTTGIIGLALGSAYFELGLLGTALVLISETLLGKLGSHIQLSPEYTVELLYNDKNALDRVLRCCKDSGMAIINLQIHSMDDLEAADYAAEIRLRGSKKANDLVADIQNMSGVVSAVDLEK